MVSCPGVRDALLVRGVEREAPFAGMTLQMREGPARSVKLVDGHGMEMKVRKFPTDRFGHRIRPVSVVEEVFSDDNGALFPPAIPTGCAPYVLWSPDMETGLLEDAWFAWASDLDSGSGVTVYHPISLPTSTRPSLVKSTLPPPLPEDDFDDDFGAAGEAPTTGPA